MSVSLEAIDAEIAKKQLQAIDAEIQKRDPSALQQIARHVKGTFNNIASGAAMNWDDEIKAGVAAGVVKANEFLTPSLFPAKESFSDVYNQAKTEINQEQGEYRRQNPITSGIAEFGGAMATGGFGAAKTAGYTGAKRFLANTGIGAGYGAMSGAGASESGRTGTGAVEGGVIGTGLAIILGTLGVAGRTLMERLTAGKPVEIADRKILEAILNDKKTPQEVKDEVLQWGNKATIPDVTGESSVRLARQSRSVPGESAEIAEDFYQVRMKGEYGRIMSKAKALLGQDKNYFKTLEELKADRKIAADPVYKEAYEIPIKITPKLQEMIDGYPSFQKALKKAIAKGNDEGIKLDPNIIDTRRLDYTKRALDDMYAAAPFGSDKKRVIENIIKKIFKEVDPQNPKYKEARGIWSGSKELEDALELGSNVMKGEADLVSRTIKDMTPAQMEFFRIGVLRGLKNRIAGTRDINSIAKMFENEAMRERLSLVFPDEKAYKDFLSELLQESRFADVRNKILAGSQTAEKLSDQVNYGRVPGIATDVAQGNVVQAGVSAVREGWDFLVRPNPKVAKEVITKMTATDKAELVRYLDNLESTGNINPGYRKLLDSFIGASAIEAGQIN